ncbi:MAG: histidine phosphatase family protein [Patescibacteria group bacterium]
MKLYLARHAQTNYNIQKLANSDPSVDVHLSEEGIKQAKNLGKLLEAVDFDIVFISELPRTRETAGYINDYHHNEYIIDGRLNDNKTGFESQPVDEWLKALDDSDNRWDAKFNGGESLNEAASRARDFIEFLKTQPYESVLVVTHGFLTQAIFGYIENKSLEEAAEFNLLQGTYAEFDLTAIKQ